MQRILFDCRGGGDVAGDATPVRGGELNTLVGLDTLTRNVEKLFVQSPALGALEAIDFAFSDPPHLPLRLKSVSIGGHALSFSSLEFSRILFSPDPCLFIAWDRIFTLILSTSTEQVINVGRREGVHCG